MIRFRKRVDSFPERVWARLTFSGQRQVFQVVEVIPNEQNHLSH